MFCKKCGSLLKVKKKGEKNVKYCECGYEEEGGLTFSEQEKEIDKISEKVVEDDLKHLPKTSDVECPKCGNNEAYYWIMQTRAGDEAPTQFFRCTNCKFTWRSYN